MPNRMAVVIVDPQRAYVDPEGSFAKAYGLRELGPLRDCFLRLSGIVDDTSMRLPTVVVRSEYASGDRTNGDCDAPLGHLCVPGSGVDCEFAFPITETDRRKIVTKRGIDAWSEEQFRDAVRAITPAVDRIFVCGVTTTSCVRALAISLAREWAAPAKERSVSVALTLTAARRSAYELRGSAVSKFQLALIQLRASGVNLCFGIRANIPGR